MLRSTNRVCSALVVLVGLFVVDVSLASAGPWVPAAGESYTQAGLSFTHATDRREYLLNFYGEFGIYERLAVIVGVPIKYLDRTAPSPTGDPQGSFFALSPSVGLRYQLTRGRVALALQEDVTIPFAGGSFNLTSQFFAGASLGSSGRGFVQGMGGFRLRSGEDAHEALWSADVGAWLTSGMLAMATYRGRWQVGTDREAEFADREHQLGGQLIVRLNEELSLGAEVIQTLRTESVPRSTTATLYIARRH
ncbi:MAG: hypothetical protein ACI9KE_004223 [Polyangiales bacterium]|jgi:hypothetical protein